MKCKTMFLHLVLIAVTILCVTVSCGVPAGQEEADRWNDIAYSFHYRNLDSVAANAGRAYQVSERYDDGRAEALNNFAFVDIARMDYSKAEKRLGEVGEITNNQIELMVADVQMMRLCQRRSENKNFYRFMQSAMSRLARIRENDAEFTPRQQRRLVYAQSEYYITVSAYLYYVGQTVESSAALAEIDANGEIVKDTAQLLNYYYNVGAGGIISGDTKESIAQTEFNYLMRCYLLSRQYHYAYWEANSLQALSEHLQDDAQRRILLHNNPQEVEYLNVDNMPDRLLAGNLAQRALALFGKYGDVYQVAGAYRTLAECYWAISDYGSALACLNSALGKNRLVELAPDLVASIREQLSLVYSAVNDKRRSDMNRNIYLDIQENTRQDRMLEARAEQLDQSLTTLNFMIAAVVATIILVGTILFRLGYIRRRRMRTMSVDALKEPLAKWKQSQEKQAEAEADEMEELAEQTSMAEEELRRNRWQYIEQRAKISLVNSVTPLVGRMAREVALLEENGGDDNIRKERYEYIAELTDKIVACNNALTKWIQMRQGELQLHIESFCLQDIFDTLSQGKMLYTLKDINLEIVPTNLVVKADKTLTLFMLNTMADNARKHSRQNGHIKVSCEDMGDCVEISVADDGEGMPEQQLEHVFDHKAIVDNAVGEKNNVGETAAHHGFGLLNCKGIIEKYRKMSGFFSKCMISAESKEGEGSRFFFRLPKGVLRPIAVAAMLLLPLSSVVCLAKSAPQRARGASVVAGAGNRWLAMAGVFADSAYFSNIEGRYGKTLEYADSCLKYMNMHYYGTLHGKGRELVLFDANGVCPAEIEWFRDSVRVDYGIILDVRNETAVAALALHKWKLYRYNNNVYTQLFRDSSADNTLADYVSVMQKSENSKNVAMVLLLFFFMLIFPIYYILYYRHRIYYNICVDNVRKLNSLLSGDAGSDSSLAAMDKIWTANDNAMVANEHLAKLQELVSEIRNSLNDGMERHKKHADNMRIAGDNLKRIKLDSDNLYVSNKIIDNCLSTLKHETMYYPTRIRQLVDGSDGNLQAIGELVNYYRVIYSVLSIQAMRVVESQGIPGNYSMECLYGLLKKANDGKSPQWQVKSSESGYVGLEIVLPNLHLDDKQCRSLFTEATCNVAFLVCRQIVRDIGERYHARGCGISASPSAESATTIYIKIAGLAWKNSMWS